MLKNYIIKFHVSTGFGNQIMQIQLNRQGENMEACKAATEIEIEKKWGHQWDKGIAIYDDEEDE